MPFFANEKLNRYSLGKYFSLSEIKNDILIVQNNPENLFPSVKSCKKKKSQNLLCPFVCNTFVTCKVYTPLDSKTCMRTKGKGIRRV